MEQIGVSIPDEAAHIVKVIARNSGQSESSVASQLLTPAIYEEASRRFRATNYLRNVGEPFTPKGAIAPTTDE